MTINFDNIDDLYIEEPGYLGPSAKQKLYVNDTLIWAKMTVYFDVNTGSSVNNKTVYYNRTYGTLPTTSKTGHTFNGWFTDETWGTEVTEETICNQVDNHTLYAKLDINYYTITFKNYQGSVVDTQSVPYGSTPSTPSGTADTAQYEYSWPTINPATKNITYQETRTVKSYTVTWKDWNGTTLKTEPVAYGGNGTPPSQPTRTGYTFSGWSGNYTGITGNVTITATYTINKYTVTFKDWDGILIQTQMVAYGGSATPPSNPIRIGYTFTGWSGDYTYVTSNVTITATYTINYYTVTFKDWDGTTLKTQSVAYGSNATPPANPTRTGYTFSGWSGTYTNVTSNRTITATYTAVNATSWSMLGAGNYDYVASFEKTAVFIDLTVNGCGYMKTDLPSASLYLVGDIVRGRLNPASGGTCDTWVYYEAV